MTKKSKEPNGKTCQKIGFVLFAAQVKTPSSNKKTKKNSDARITFFIKMLLCFGYENSDCDSEQTQS